MTEYLPPHEACEKAGITLYHLEKLIAHGKVRFQETTDITGKRQAPLRFVCAGDILDAQNGVELSFIDIKNVPEEYGITTSAVRYHIKRGRLRWRRTGLNLQPCKADLDQFVQGAFSLPCNHPNGSILPQAQM